MVNDRGFGFMHRLSSAALLLAAAAAVPAHAGVLKVRSATSVNLGDASEIPAYDDAGRRLFVVGVDGDASFVKIVDAKTRAVLGALDTESHFAGGEANSVAVGGGKVAVALAAANRTDPGRVLVYDLANLGAAPQSFTVGALPDQVSFSADGSRLLVANEGEPNSYGLADSVDPEGSVSYIDLAAGTVRTAGFSAFNAQKSALQAAGVRIFGPGASVAQDLEPEFTAFAADGRTAFVTLQENNAIGVIDLDAPGGPVVTQIVPLGFKSYAPGVNAMDPSDRDGSKGNLVSRAGVYGLYQPDAIKAFTSNGKSYFAIANEGDAREYDGFEEEVRASSLGSFDVFNRLNVTNSLGATGPADGQLYAFGGRSFSILDAAGNIVFDSGDVIERILAARFPDALDDGRSDNKGPEPEAVEVGVVDGRLVLFLGLERANGGSLGSILAFDITDFGLGVDPTYLGAIVSNLLGRPEGLAYFTRAGRSFLAAADEETGNLAIFALNVVSEPAALALFGLGLAGMVAARRRRA
jgi:DNA-binding beta-propeller fold protein YncE